MKKLSKSPFFVALAAILLAVVLPPAFAQSGFKVIVHRDNPVTSLSKDDFSNMLLKKKTRWDNGVSVSPVDLDSKSPIRADMSKEAHGRSVSSIKNFWQRQIFSGREVPPPEMSSDGDVVRFVASDPGAIGYVSVGASVSGVDYRVSAFENLSAKEQLMAILGDQPGDGSFEDLLRTLAFHRLVERGDAGRRQARISGEEMRRRLQSWD